MSINSVFSSARLGIQTGMNITDRAGGKIAMPSTATDNDQLARLMVDLRIGENQVKLSANVVKVADQMLGSLIDIRA